MQLYKNQQNQFTSPKPSAFVDLTGADSNTKDQFKKEFDFAFDEFSDDDNLDLDFEVPKALPTLPPMKKMSDKENMPPPMSTPVSKSMDWSSSPAAHFLPPKQYQAMNSVDAQQERPDLKRESSGETIEDEPERTHRKAKRRMLPASFTSSESKTEVEIISERIIHTAQQTPSSKARGYLDPTASAIKEQRKQLKERSAAGKPDADATTTKAGKVFDEEELSTVMKPKSDTLTLSTEQRRVLDMVVEQGKSVFFTGPAGTGKSVLMRAIITELQNKYGHNTDRVAVTASTGLAACNIGGITLHSFSGIGLGKEPANQLIKKIRRNAKAKQRWMRTKCLIIDEISMVDGQLFDKLSQIGRTIRNNGRPWGGIQLIITGDFLQLPPVPDGEQKESVFAFDASTWETSLDHTIGLTQVFRQKDPEFANMLNEMRIGNITEKTVNAFKALSRPLTFNDGIEGAQLYPTRMQVEASNERRLRELPGEARRFDSLDTGDPAVRDKLLVNMMAPKGIVLKIGAQVMLIKNLDDTLVNGSLGTVVDFGDQKTMEARYAMEDELGGNMAKAQKKLNQFKHEAAASKTPQYPVVRFMATNGTSRTIICIPEEWKVELPNGEVQAKRQQVPLILAWALSIHKAQGQTLDRVTVDLGRVFEKGQAYVALSRATTQQGLRVLNFDKSKVMAHPKVVDFYKKLYSADAASKVRPTSIADFIAARKGVRSD